LEGIALLQQGICEGANKKQYGSSDGGRREFTLRWSSAQHPISHRSCKAASQRGLFVNLVLRLAVSEVQLQ